MISSLILPAFLAGLLAFLAPCTLPLVPGYLGFISGVSFQDVKNPQVSLRARKKIILNSLFYILGFSAVFIILGSLFGLGGAALIEYRLLLSRIGGLLIIFFGLFMLGVFRLPALNMEKHLVGVKAFKPGNPWSSFLFGATFAFGWTPCVGPILGSILTLAAASATVFQGAFLLSIFSLGLALPFFLIALSIGSAYGTISRLTKLLPIITRFGGAFLLILGIMLFTNQLDVWTGFIYRLFDFIAYDRLQNYL